MTSKTRLERVPSKLTPSLPDPQFNIEKTASEPPARHTESVKPPLTNTFRAMARRSLRASTSNASTPAKANAKSPATSTGKRGRATPKHSQHFTPKSRGSSSRKGVKQAGSSEDELSPTKVTPKHEDAEEEEEEDDVEPSSDEDDDASAFEEDDDVAAADSDEDNDEEDEYASDDDEIGDAPPTKKLKTASSSKGTPAKAKKGQELWRTNVKTGLGPGNAVTIQRPKARPAGKTPYEPHTIHPNTYLFLQDLAENNDREWLKMHDPDYRTSWKDFTEWLECLGEKITESDETVPELPVKDVVFRIYRDVRFTNDPTPYKTHFSAAWSRTGRKGPFAAYYVQIKPGESFVGGGLWMPEAQALAKLRRDIDRKPHKIKAVLTEANIRKTFLDGIGADEKKAVKAFVKQNQENALKTKPKGFDANHPNIDLLRLRSFTMGAKIPKDDEIIGSKGLDYVAGVIKALVPFITYLNSVVMPDDPEEESDSEEEEEAEDAGDAA